MLYRRRGALLAAFLGSVTAASAPLSDRPSFAHAAERPTFVRPTGCAAPPELAAVCCAKDAPDEDGDGVGDACEQALAERYAPIVYHSTDESNFPTNVDAFLPETHLGAFDLDCADDAAKSIATHPTQADLASRTWRPPCGSGADVRAAGTRSVGKHRSFFLADVPEPVRAGSSDTTAWTTYFHAYPNDVGGITIQYWRFYAYNDALNDHGGDWEGLHVVTDPSLQISSLRLLAHSELRDLPRSRFTFEGTHVHVFSEGGGHATRFSGDEIAARGCNHLGRCVIDLDEPATFVRQETWPGGQVRDARGVRGKTGALVNLGAKTSPMNGQSFVQYSGMWGSPGMLYSTSGYWGPAFNETGMRADGFLSAWCEGIVSKNLKEECFPVTTSP